MISVKTSPSFGKFPVMECRVKSASSQMPQKATLFMLNPNLKTDLLEVNRSKNTNCIKYSFKKAFALGDNLNEYYILQDNYSNEVISCAQIVRKLRPHYAVNSGYSTQIRAMSENKKYINALEPMLAFITKRAAIRGDNSVYAPYNKYDASRWSDWNPYELPTLKELKVCECGKDGICIPKYSFDYFISKASKNRKINFLF